MTVVEQVVEGVAEPVRVRGLVLPGDVERVAHYVEASRAEATRAAYASDWRAWQTYATARGFQDLPADPGQVASWLTNLADAGASPATCARRLAGLSDAHRTAGHLVPSEHVGVRRVMRGIRREAVTQGRRPRKARAVDTVTVRALVEDLPDTTGGVRDRALILVAFALGLRASDVCWLDVEDLAPTASGAGFDVSIKRSKTDQEGEGEVLALAPGARSVTCPVTALQAWVAAAAVTSGPLFRAVTKGGQVGTARLSSRAVSPILTRAARRAGVPLDRLSAHSLRRGYASSAYANGVPEQEIARTGRWRSVTVMRGYDDSSRWADPASARLGL